MKWIDILVVAVIAAIVGLVSFYLHRAKKKGIRCIGCPDAGICSGNCDRCTGNCSGCKNEQ